MREGRLPKDFRDRTKQFAALIIRLYVELPKGREEIQVCAKQFLRAGTSVAVHAREASRARSDDLCPNLAEHFRKQMKASFGWNSCVRNVASVLIKRRLSSKKPMNLSPS
jgi:hypothetical protein